MLTEHASVLPQPLAKAIHNGIAFDKAVAALRRYSLIGADETGFSVHRLVQAVTRANLSDRLPWADAAIALINAAFPDDSDDARSWPVCARLRSHAEAVLAAAQRTSSPMRPTPADY